MADLSCNLDIRDNTESNTSSPKPRLTRIRSLLSLQSSSRGVSVVKQQTRSILHSSAFSELNPLSSAAESQPLSQLVANIPLSKQSTFVLSDMGDSTCDGKMPLVRRVSTRLRKQPSTTPASLTIDELCAPLPRSLSKVLSAKLVKDKVANGDEEKRVSANDSDEEVMDTDPVGEDEAMDEEKEAHKGKQADKEEDHGKNKSDSTVSPSGSVPSSMSTANAFGTSNPYGPNAIELVISFDTTGSMSSCIAEVKAKVQEIVQRLFMDIPNLKIGIIAHGDYCDEMSYYLMKKVDFTNDVASLCQFVKDVGSSGGGDFDECYEWVLHQVRGLPWTPGTQRALVMIGDATPHEPSYALNKLNLDWREEANKLYEENGVHIYSVQCQDNGDKVTKFYRSLAERTNGMHLRLDKFSSIVDILMAICYREKGAEFFEAYEREVRDRDGPNLAGELDGVFNTLRNPFAPKPRTTFDFSKGASKHKGTKLATSKTATLAKIKKKSPKALAPVDRKNAKAAPKSTRATPKTSRIHREKVPRTKFLLNKLKWSQWKLCMSPVVKPGPWIPNRRGVSGYRNGSIFSDTTKRAVYEFAIQKKVGGKRYVMYMSATSGFSGVHWDTYFFRKSNIVLAEMEACIKSSGLISVRRAILPKYCSVKLEGQRKKVTLKHPKDYKKLLNKVYDYAWRNICRGRAGRAVRSKSFV